MDPRDLVALTIVALAALWLLRRARRALAGSAGGCHAAEAPKPVQIELPD